MAAAVRGMTSPLLMGQGEGRIMTPPPTGLTGDSAVSVAREASNTFQLHCLILATKQIGRLPL